MNALNWTLDREERLDILPKVVSNPPIELSTDKYRRLFWLVVFILPTAAFCFAIFVWSARRN